MARLATVGPLTTRGGTDGAHPDAGSGATAPLLNDNGTITYVTTPVRTPHGRYVAKTTVASSYHMVRTIGGVLGRSYFGRAYVYLEDVTPSANCNLLSFLDSGSATLGRLILKTDGTLITQASAQIGSASSALSVNTWYRLELQVNVAASPTSSNGTIEGRLYAASDASLLWSASSAVANLGTNAVDRMRVGWSTATTPDAAVYWCDWALNDDQGASQNSWCDQGNVGFLLPVTPDVARTGWVDGAAGTTNLFGALDNDPPGGLGSAASTASTEIEDATNNSTDTYEMSCAAYSTAVGSGGAGIASTDTIRVIQGVARGGNSTTTSRSLAVTVQSNPGPGTEATTATGTTAAATDPTGWRSFRTAPVYNSTPTLATKPTLLVRKGTASANVMAYDHAGIVVEFQSPLPNTVALGPSVAVAAATLTTLTAPTAVPLDSSAAVSVTTLALSAQTTVPLTASAAVSTTSAAVSVQTQVPLASSAAVSTTSAAVSTPTPVPLGTAAAGSTTSLSLEAATQVPLGAAPAVSATTLALSATTQIPLGLSAAVSTTTAAITAATQIPLGACAAVSTTTATVTTGAAVIPLQASAATSTTTLTLTAATQVALGSSAAVTTTTLSLKAQTQVPLAASAAVSTTSLTLSAQTTVALGTSSAVSTTSATVTAGAVQVPLQTSAATSTTTLALTAQTAVPLASAAAISTTTLSLTAKTTVPLGAGAAVSTASATVTVTTTIALGTSAAVTTTTLNLTIGVQYGRPVADIATTGWTVTPLWSKLDEAIADDADLIEGIAA